MKINIKINSKKNAPSRLSLLIIIISVLSIFITLTFLPKEKPRVKEKEESSPPQSAVESPPLIGNKEIIQKGKTLSDILSSHGFSPAEIHKLILDVKPIYDLAKIKAGKELRIYSSVHGDINSIEYNIDGEKFLSIQITEEAYKAEIKKFPFEIKIRMVCGVIENNLMSAVTGKNEKDLLAISLANMFGWDIDFYADLRHGDSFKIMFEKKYLYGRFVAYGKILAAEFVNHGKIFQAFRYTYPDTKEWDYFDFKGNSLRKQFLKSPLQSARITSRFSLRRMHPILKVYRPHYGVDYAAPIGTQVQATADGTVTFTGRNGGAGRMIKIRHKNAYETLYLHLRNFAKGIKKGAKVKEGQFIARVGSSGESTGPHLDYRIKHQGKHINPLTFNPKPIKPLRTEYLKDFQKKAKSYLFLFNLPSIPVCVFP